VQVNETNRYGEEHESGHCPNCGGFGNQVDQNGAGDVAYNCQHCQGTWWADGETKLPIEGWEDEWVDGPEPHTKLQREAVDHASIAAITGGAAKLLASIEKFKEKASPAAVNALTPHLGNIEKVLEDMLNTPGSYVAKVKVEPKKVSLKAVKKEGLVKEATRRNPFAGVPKKYRVLSTFADGSRHQSSYETLEAAERAVKLLLKPLSGNGYHTPAATNVRIVPLGEAITEATGGDGKMEKVTKQNWQHLEVGNTYLVKSGRDRTKSNFVGWVDKQGEHTDSEDPTQVDLKFVDVKDGFEWTAYHHDGGYAVGSSADPLYVREMDHHDSFGEPAPHKGESFGEPDKNFKF
jgi:hypothetical protein